MPKTKSARQSYLFLRDKKIYFYEFRRSAYEFGRLVAEDDG